MHIIFYVFFLENKSAKRQNVIFFVFFFCVCVPDMFCVKQTMVLNKDVIVWLLLDLGWNWQSGLSMWPQRTSSQTI